MVDHLKSTRWVFPDQKSLIYSIELTIHHPKQDVESYPKQILVIQLFYHQPLNLA